MSKRKAGVVAGAHTWISASRPPHGSEQRFEDGWFAGVHEVAGYLLRIADTTATAQRWRAASSGMLLAHLQQSYSPVPKESHRPWRWT
ncbi:hypothetical protein AB0F45_19410 [Streptomyces achromogenes]|uniref:hypothetical protein n=1 Tax=Streptomyces achromogenes TaxID=67255 RepID=UPI0033C867F1